MKKINYYKQIIEKNIELLKCPKCEECFELKENTIFCNNNHCFDIASKGYLNFMTGTKTTIEQYDKNLFDSREYVFKRGFFDRLIDEVKLEISQSDVRIKTIVDIGCGEGSALGAIISGTDNLGVGIDISKQGIKVAASKTMKNMILVVGDLTKTPFREKTFNVVINMLSPANYNEFERIAETKGMIIKILPGENYLKQMRTFFYGGSDKETYSNEQTTNYFKNHYEKYREKDISYEIEMDEEFLSNIAQMSPLASGKDVSVIESFKLSGISKMTVEFKILIGFMVENEKA